MENGVKAREVLWELKHVSCAIVLFDDGERSQAAIIELVGGSSGLDVSS